MRVTLETARSDYIAFMDRRGEHDMEIVDLVIRDGMMGTEMLVPKKRRASGKPQKPSADQKFPVRLGAKDTMSMFESRANTLE